MTIAVTQYPIVLASEPTIAIISLPKMVERGLQIRALTSIPYEARSRSETGEVVRPIPDTNEHSAIPTLEFHAPLMPRPGLRSPNWLSVSRPSGPTGNDGWRAKSGDDDYTRPALPWSPQLRPVPTARARPTKPPFKGSPFRCGSGTPTQGRLTLACRWQASRRPTK